MDILRLVEANNRAILKLVAELREEAKDSEAMCGRLDALEVEFRLQKDILASLEGTRRDVRTWAKALRWVAALVGAGLLFLASANSLPTIARSLGYTKTPVEAPK